MQEKQRIIADAKLKAKMDEAMLVDEILEKSIASAINSLKDIRKHKGYSTTLNRLT